MKVIHVLGAAVVLTGAAQAGELVTLSDPSGLAAEAEFTLADGGNTLIVRFKNTSTGVPMGFSNSDQILSGLSWDFGDPGINGGDPVILGGVVEIGAMSASVNFDTGSYGPGANVSGEWGYGNAGGTGHIVNFFSAQGAHATPFGGPNLDQTEEIAGPQGGLVPTPTLIALGGQGAIENEVVATLFISQALPNLDFLANGVRAEFGSDAAFITTPVCEQLAFSMPLGKPCGATLTIDPPIQGAVTTACVDGNSPDSPGILYISWTGGAPFFFQGCEIFLGPVGLAPKAIFVTDANGDWCMDFMLLPNPERCGQQFILQAIVVSDSGPIPLGEITNAVLVGEGS